MRRMLRVSTVVIGVAASPLLLHSTGASAIPAAPPTSAVWSGNGDGVHFSDPGNWVGGTAPTDGAALDLHAAACAAPLHNDVAGSLHVTGLRTPDAWCTIVGNPLHLAGTVDAGGLVLRTPVVLDADTTFATGTVRPADLDLDGHMLRIDATVDPVLEDSSSVRDSAGGGRIVVSTDGSLWANGVDAVPVIADGNPGAPAHNALWLRGSWGTVDATATVVNTADATFAALALHGARLWPWGPVTVGGDLVLDGGSTLNAGSDFAAQYSLHVHGDLTLTRARFSTAALASVTPHLDVAIVDGAVQGTFDGLTEGMILGVGTRDAFRFSYVGGDGNDPTLDWVEPDTGPTGTTTAGATGVEGDVDGEVGMSATERLPETGTATSRDAAFGLLLLAAGGALLLRTRRRPA